MFQRLYIRKMSAFRTEPANIATLKAQLNLADLKSIETVALYDLYHFPDEHLETAIKQVFSDPVTDKVLEKLPDADFIFVVEPLSGQFDQRADSAEQCLALIHPDFAQAKVYSSVAYLVSGQLNEDEQLRLKQYFINPVEVREKDLSQQLLLESSTPENISRFGDFNQLDALMLAQWHQDQGLAMTLADLQLVQNYFQQQKRAPSETEIRVLDTYWSDHCRHTTFATELQYIAFPDSGIGKAVRNDYEDFIAKRYYVYGEEADNRPVTLMELATIDAKYQRKQGNLDDVEFSAEVNACSVFVDVTENGDTRPWLLQFKNETHNHPTEIEPFGGASTCIGGAIRDPLSGRAYVYQAMRLSGSADPRQTIADTLPSKLPQRVIAQRSAAGASSYGNQIGLATGQVVEVYHPGYQAKHMEVGAVVGATPAEHVRREKPQAGDVVILLGGATGRDGCGGATGSSREQHDDSLRNSAAEVQKGNPPEERKLQRLFRKGSFARMIKRCNDFGAGGVSVAIGELADGVVINLDAVPVKYQGLSGTELAISESQERMAIVIAPENVEEVKAMATAENLMASEIALITDDEMLTMLWRDEVIVSISRAFLNCNGAPNQQTEIVLSVPPQLSTPYQMKNDDWVTTLEWQLQDLNHADLRGIGDRFDFSVGAGCVLKPYGGRFNTTPAEASVYALPTETPCETASIIAYGFNPDYSAQSSYHGAMNAVAEAAARLIAVGGDIHRAHFSLQEYFPKLGQDAKLWGLPTAALLGAHHALSGLNRAAIGGKDSMSGSFNHLDVPPTLIAFAVSTVDMAEVVSPEFKIAGDQIYWLRCPQDEFSRPDFSALLANNDFIREAINDGLIHSIRSIRHGGLMQALYESAIGNRIGCRIDQLPENVFLAEYGGFLISSSGGLGIADNLIHLGYTTEKPTLNIAGKHAELNTLYELNQTLADVYPLYSEKQGSTPPDISPETLPAIKPIYHKLAVPRVCMPVFPGTNSELDTARAFCLAGGEVQETVICNRNQTDIDNSLQALADNLRNSQIFVLSGGFSAGDEPDGSGKFIANILFNAQIRDAVADFLQRDGLILGICNGFQALVKCGLLPFGEIRSSQIGHPTLTHNRVNRHIARIATTKIVNNQSPWLSRFEIGEAHDLAFSHGEGRFYADEAVLQQLSKNGQIATQYVHPYTLNPSMSPEYNPNGSRYAVEGITSPCGRILGKMGHSERYRAGLYKNHPDFRPQDIFSAGVQAFR